MRVHVDAEQWCLTCVYGEPRVENRHEMWTKVRNLKGGNDRPWLVIRESNDAPWDFKHFSATPRPEPHMIAFRDTLDVCGHR